MPFEKSTGAKYESLSLNVVVEKGSKLVTEPVILIIDAMTLGQ
jgi:hypothetical protein